MANMALKSQAKKAARARKLGEGVADRPDGVLIRPAEVVPVEIHTPERRAEFLLSTAIDAEDYARAVADVRAMGVEFRTRSRPGPEIAWIASCAAGGSRAC